MARQTSNNVQVYTELVKAYPLIHVLYDFSVENAA